MRAPAVPLFLAAIVGAWLGAAAQIAPAAAVSVLVVFGVVAVLVRPPIARAALVLATAFTAALAVSARARSVHDAGVHALPDGPAVFVGIVDAAGPTRSGAMRLLLHTDGAMRGADAVPYAASLDVFLVDDAARVPVQPGDRVRVRGVARAYDPALAPGTYDGALAALARGVDGRLSVRSPGDVAVVEHGAAARPFARTRASLERRVRALATPKEATTLLALLVGDTSGFDEEELQRYRLVGAGHLLAVSGLQVTLLAVIAERALRFLFALAARRRRAIVASSIGAILVVWAFAAVCGLPPSAVRAAAMATAVLAAPLLSRRASSADALGIAGLATVLLNPGAALDAGFLLSYGAVIGLLAATPPSALDDDEPSPRRALARRGFALALSACGAGLATLPLSAHFFGQVALGGVVANVVLVPVASIVQAPALVLGFLGALASSSTLVVIAAQAAGILEALVEGLGVPFGGLIDVAAPDAALTAVLGVAGLLIVSGLARRSARAVVAGALFGAGAMVPLVVSPAGVRITALVVGQGDAAVFELPDGRVLLIDGGGDVQSRSDPGRSVIEPFLRRRGIHRIDVVVLSHPHPDHALGLLPLLEDLPIGEVWTPGFAAEDPLMARVLEAARRKGVPVKTTPDLLGPHSFGDVVVDVLGPAPVERTGVYPELETNDNSLVLRISYGADAALWPGDVEALGEEQLVATAKERLRAAVVKAGHHGSSTSSTDAFVQATGAREVLLCTGRGNTFGFPHASVVERWTAAGARVWDTAQEGETTFFLTGDGVVARAHRRR